MLKDKYPLKSETHIQSLLEGVQNGRIEESMWTKIIEKMYEDQDAQVLQENIRAIIQMRANG
jgi:archaellum component FlaC